MSFEQRRANMVANNHVYKTMVTVFAARAPGEVAFDPTSNIAHEAAGRIASFRALGIDDKQITVGSAKANIDLVQHIDATRNLDPEDFNGQVEE